MTESLFLPEAERKVRQSFLRRRFAALRTKLPANSRDGNVRSFGRNARDRIRAVGVDRYEFTADWRDVAPHAIAFRSSVFIATKPAV